MVGIANGPVVLEIQPGLFPVIGAGHERRLRDQREGQIVDLVGIRVATVLPLNQGQQPGDRIVGFRIQLPDKVVHGAQEGTYLAAPAVGAIEYGRDFPGDEVGAVLGSNNAAVGVPGQFHLGARALLKGLDDRGGEAFDDRVLHPDHVPVNDGDALEVGACLRVQQVRRQAGAQTHSRQAGGHGNEIAPGIPCIEVHDRLPVWLFALSSAGSYRPGNVCQRTAGTLLKVPG